MRAQQTGPLRRIGVLLEHEGTMNRISRATRAVSLHDETENPVDMVKVFEGRLLICAISIPDDLKPLARLDQVGADQ